MTKRLFLTLACLSLPLASLARQAAPPASPASSGQPAQSSSLADLTNLLDAKIKAEWEAFKNKDKKAYADLLTDDYIAIEADNEGERTKTHMLREIEHSMFTDYTLSFLKVTPLGPDAAFVRYESFFRFPPGSAVRFEKVIIGEIWVKRDGQWKSLHYQETRVK
jgi:ketosteroid isomerase-like protein